VSEEVILISINWKQFEAVLSMWARCFPLGKSLAVRRTAFVVHLLGVPWHAAGATACLQDSNRCAVTFRCDFVALLLYNLVIGIYSISPINRGRQGLSTYIGLTMFSGFMIE